MSIQVTTSRKRQCIFPSYVLAGMTYIHRKEQPVDDQVQLEALIIIADHPNATDGATISVNFAIKVY